MAKKTKPTAAEQRDKDRWSNFYTGVFFVWFFAMLVAFCMGTSSSRR